MWGGQRVDDDDHSGQALDQKPHANEGDDCNEGPFDTLTSGVGKFFKKDRDQAAQCVLHSRPPYAITGPCEVAMPVRSLIGWLLHKSLILNRSDPASPQQVRECAQCAHSSLCIKCASHPLFVVTARIFETSAGIENLRYKARVATEVTMETSLNRCLL